MVHQESSTKVYYTQDYALFNMINGNRQLNETKIKKIKNDINSGTDVLRFCPILVIENKGRLDIIDGQHRFYVSRSLKSKVWYIIATEMSLYDIARINSNTEKWKGSDFVNCYVQLGNDNYIKLRQFMDAYRGVPLSTAISILETGVVNDGGGTKTKFERGEFSATHWDFANELLGKSTMFDVPFCMSRPFIKAVLKIINSKKVNIEDVAAKVNIDPMALEKCDHEKDYLTALENIVNKGKHSRVVIY